MKRTGLFLLAIVVIVGGYLIIKNSEQGSGNVSATSGEVTEVSLDQIAFDGPAIIKILDLEGNSKTIAVPSMGINLCAAREQIADVGQVALGDIVMVSGSVDEDGNIVPCESADHYLFITGFMTDAVYGYEFAYRKGPDGYITLEDTESTDPDYVTGITLFNKKEYESFKEATDAREGPTAMHVRVYKNSGKLHAPVWALRKPLESNIELAIGEPQETVVGGANATFYTVDGLYLIDTYIIANGDHIYVLMGSYMDKESSIYKDFQELVSSFAFVSKSSNELQSKIDPKVACESALAYMTFVSGRESDAFVDACIRGEYPEVIDRYIKEMGLDGTTI